MWACLKFSQLDYICNMWYSSDAFHFQSPFYLEWAVRPSSLTPPSGASMVIQETHIKPMDRAMRHALVTAISMFKYDGGKLSDFLDLAEEYFKDTGLVFESLTKELYT